MKTINEVQQKDIELLDKIDRDCLAMHVCPPPKTFIDISVHSDKDEQVLDQKVRSQSWNRNAYNILMSCMGTASLNILGPGFGAGKLGIKKTDASITDTGTLFPSGNGNVGGAGEVIRGIVVGAEDRAESLESFALAAQFDNGTNERAKALPIDTSKFATDACYAIAMSPDDKYLIVGNTSAPYIRGFIFSKGDVTQITVPSLPSTPTGMRFSPNGTYLAINLSSTIAIWKNNGDDTFTSVTTIAAGSGSSVGVMDWSSDSKYLTFSIYGVSPYWGIIKNNGDNTFTKLTGLPVANTTTGSGIGFSPNGTYIILSGNTAPYITAFKNNNDDTFTKLTIPAGTYAGANRKRIVFSPNGQLFTPPTESGNCDVYKNNGDDTFTKLPTLTLPCGGPQILEFTKDGKFFISTGSTSPGLKLFTYTDAGVFTQVDNGGYVLNGCVFYDSIATTSDGKYFILGVGNASPYIRMYRIQPTLSYAAQTTSTATYDSGTKKMTVTLTRVFNNNSAVDVVVKELGQYFYLQGYYAMLNRDVLSAPVTIPPAYKMTVTYKMELTFPA